ncbi:HAD family hydrolase [Sphingobacterium multivorum]|uniref:HAD family hydrolase n=1 Tax=Sphingobacterium multivorum TaxID=28454 RepID=UPI003DA6C11D
MKTKYIIFDLDDTLVYEVDFLKSAYLEIADRLDHQHSSALANKMYDWYIRGLNVFEKLKESYDHLTKEELLGIYRNHKPAIKLIEGGKELLDFCKSKGYKLGLITDGRSITQRNKITALGITEYFDKIIISEEFGTTKPNRNNFEVFKDSNVESYYYIADNVSKDFVTPNLLGWKTICLLDRGLNVHEQNFEKDLSFLPKYKVFGLEEIIKIVD